MNTRDVISVNLVIVIGLCGAILFLLGCVAHDFETVVAGLVFVVFFKFAWAFEKWKRDHSS